MSGHSRWSNIKNKKGKSDFAKSKIYSKIGRELLQAVKQGGKDPLVNFKLRDIMDKAKRANMPSDNIQRIINKASGASNSINYENITYEGYAPNGVAIIIEALTDNKNRTAGEVRHLFERNGGNMGTSGCVSYLFSKKGIFNVAKQNKTEEEIMEFCVNGEATDFEILDNEVEIITEVANYPNFKSLLEKNGYDILVAEIEYIPNSYIKLDKEAQLKLINMIEKMEENDDIIKVYHNGEIDIEE